MLYFIAGVVACLIWRALFLSSVSDGDQLWVVGEVKSFKNNAWEFVGVFDDEEVAKEHCGKFCFIGPVRLGEAFEESIPWPNAYFPKMRGGGDDLPEMPEED